MPWIKEEKLYPILVLLLIFILAARVPLDSDMWWHLRAGDETIQTGQVYRTDTFSSSRNGTDWINHSWLSQVLMAGLMRIGDLPALSIWVALCAVISMGLVYLQMEGHPLLRGAVLLLAAMVSSVVWSPRPQIMSLVMLAFLCWLVFKYRETRNWRYLAPIPFIFALWGNLHGGYVLGLIYLGSYVGGEVLDRILIQEGSRVLNWKEIGLIAAAMVAGFVMVLVNPFGIEMWKIPFNTVGVETLQNLINEWSSPDFHQAFQQPLLWMMLGLMGLMGVTGKAVKGYKLIPMILFAWAALVARRNFGPFAIIGAPVFAEQASILMADWIDKAKGKIPFVENALQSAEDNKANFNLTARNVTNLSLILLLMFVAVVKTVQVNQTDLLDEVEDSMFPVGAVEWLTESGQTEGLFNDYNWGGYLIYQMPKSPVFVDGRTDLFGDVVLNDYLAVMRVDDNWEGILIKYGLDTLLLRNDSNLAKMALIQGWSEVYRDDLAIVLKND